MSLSQVNGCLSCQCGISLEMLLPHLAGVITETAELEDGRLRIWAHSGAEGAACPRCGQFSARVHSPYQRRLADAPVGGRPVALRLGVRRFFCGNAGCTAVTFAEQFEGLTSPRSRRTPPLARHADRDRPGPGRAGRDPARRRAGPDGQPDRHAAAGHGAARPRSRHRDDPGDRRLRVPPRPGLRHHPDRRRDRQAR